MVTLVNRAKVATATTGTGTITLGAAEDGYQTFADAGVTDGDVVRYVIEDGTDWEIGTGTYTASGTTLSRTVSESSNSDAAINLTGNAVVFITAVVADILQPDNNLSDLASASTARSNLGLGTIATQDSNNVNITGGSITGITDLAVADGGTGASSFTANNVLLGNGASSFQTVAPGTSGNVLTSNGSTWTSAPAGAALDGETDSASPFETSLGSGAGAVNTGVKNTFIGFEAGNDNTNGNDNVAVGYQALDANTTGDFNVAMGSGALDANTTGADNAALGTYSLRSNTTGVRNTALGGSALAANTIGEDNVAVGYQALYANTTGTRNTALGMFALAANTTGTDNVAVGHNALDANTTGKRNVAMGSRALGANTTGASNTAVGVDSLSFNSTGTNNTAVGRVALRLNTTGTNNVAMGRAALETNTTGINNVAVGYQALDANTTGQQNVALGSGALGANTTGQQNVAVGYQSGDKITTGTQNTILGMGAASSGTNDLTTGSNNTVIGYLAAASSATANDEITLGNSSISALRCQVTTISSLSDARDKTNISDLPAGLTFVNELRPVEFDWNMRDGGKVGIHDTGFIAQDLQAAQEATGVHIPYLVYDNNPDKLEAGYGKLIPVLVKAIQELSAEVENLKSKLEGA